MSDARPGKREWRFYLDDMFVFAGKEQAYTAGFERATFVTDGLTYDATLRNLALIGESAIRIPEAFRAAHPEILWR